MRLPGLGPKSASRLTFYLLRAPQHQAEQLAEAILDMREKVSFCSQCFNITDQDPCLLCTGEDRERSTLCVVEEPLDVVALERTGGYRGLYHVLHGAISPIEGVGPENLRIAELLARIRGGGVEEVILATNPNLEGEATAMYLARQIAVDFPDRNILVTRLARGLPMGSDLEYADEITLSRAIEGRRAM
jgi:recombination protein RecR